MFKGLDKTCRYIKCEVSKAKDDKMNYEYDIELCEYNPVSVEYENELRMLAKIVEVPAASLFQRLMKKIVCAKSVEA